MEEAAIGVDIGATYTKYGIMNKSGKLLAFGKINTKAGSCFDDYLDNLILALNSLKSETNAADIDIAGVGIGTPNGSTFTGCIEHAANLPWKGIVPIVEKIKTRLRTDVFMTNDANAAALGEMFYGQAKGLTNFIEVTLGTGVGCGIIADGKLMLGKHGLAGELGHARVQGGNRICGCGNAGCLETYASAGGLVRNVFELLAQKNSTSSSLAKIPFAAMTAEDVSKAATTGDDLALAAFDMTAKFLGIKIADAVKFADPEAVILFGGLAGAGEILRKPTERYMEESLPAAFKGKTKLLTSNIKEGAVAGACSLVWYNIS